MPTDGLSIRFNSVRSSKQYIKQFSHMETVSLSTHESAHAEKQGFCANFMEICAVISYIDYIWNTPY